MGPQRGLRQASLDDIEDIAAVVTEMEALADSTVVVEAVAEDLAVKKEIARPAG